MSTSDPSSPIQSKGIRSFSVSAPYPSNHEVDTARMILENNNSKFMRIKKAKSRTIDKRTVYEEIEALQTELMKREKDYQLVVEVGKMLLEKNKELSDQDEILKRQFSLSLQERDSKITTLCTKLESYESLERDMLNEMKGLRLQVNSFKSGNESSETKALELFHEYKKIEEELKTTKQQLTQQRNKNKELIEESEKYKSDLEALQTNERILRRQLKSTSSMLSVAENLASPRKELESETQSSEKISEDLKMTQRANQRLEKQMEDLLKENQRLKETIEQREYAQDQLELTLKALHSTNQRLQRQEEEQKRLLEEKVTVISTLQTQIEESIVGGGHSLIGFRDSKSLDRELLQLQLQKEHEEAKKSHRKRSVGKSSEFSSLAAELAAGDSLKPDSLAAELGILELKKSSKSVSFDGSPSASRRESNAVLENLRNSREMREEDLSQSNQLDVPRSRSESNSSPSSKSRSESRSSPSSTKSRSDSLTSSRPRSNSNSNALSTSQNQESETTKSPSDSRKDPNPLEESQPFPLVESKTSESTHSDSHEQSNQESSRHSGTSQSTTIVESSPSNSRNAVTTSVVEGEEAEEEVKPKRNSKSIVPPLQLDSHQDSSNQQQDSVDSRTLISRQDSVQQDEMSDSSTFSRDNSIDEMNKTYESEEEEENSDEDFSPIEQMDRGQLSEEVLKLRDHKREEVKYSRIFAEMRERLNGAEIRNLTRLMRTENFIFDLIDISNSIIDGVSKDIQTKILDNPPDNQLVHLLAAVLYETCRLRKISNDYMEAINRGTVEKLEEWNRKFEAEQQAEQQQQKQSSGSATSSPADSKKKSWFWQKWL